MDENQEQQVQQASYNKYTKRSSDPFDLPEEFAMIAAADEARRQAAKSQDGEAAPSTETSLEKKVKLRVKKIRSHHFKNLKAKVDPKQKLSISDAVAKVIELSQENFDASIELNIVSKKDTLSGSINLPHGTGKQKKVVVFSDAILKQIEEKQINFDILVAKPEDMGKLAKYAKILGPKGLMPNPKNGTVSKDPEKSAKDLGGNKLHYKTDKKAPLIHLIVGKRSFGLDKLCDNITAIIKAIDPKKIKSATLGSSMSPAVKLDLEKLSL